MASNFAKDQPAGYTNFIRKVAMVGAGGAIGEHIARELVKTGKHTVTALTRADSSSKLPEGVQPVSVNYDGNGDDIVAALQGQDVLIITLSVTTPPEVQPKLIQAAGKAGVKYVFPNAWGGDVLNESVRHSGFGWDRFEDVLKMIEEAGVCSWITFVSGFWYDHSLILPDAFGFDLREKKVTFFDDGETKMNVVTKEQTGRAIAALLSLKILPDDENDKSPTLSKWKNNGVYASSFLINQKDMFESLKRITGDKDEDWTIEYEPSSIRFQNGIRRMKAGDRIGFMQAMYSRMFFPNGDGNIERKGLANEVLGLPTEDLDENTKLAKAMVDRGYHYFTNRN